MAFKKAENMLLTKNIIAVIIPILNLLASYFLIALTWSAEKGCQKENGKGIISTFMDHPNSSLGKEHYYVVENTNHLQNTQSRIILNPNHRFESLNSEVSWPSDYRLSGRQKQPILYPPFASSQKVFKRRMKTP